MRTISSAVLGILLLWGLCAQVALAKQSVKPPASWSTYVATDGVYAWAEPTDWVADEAASAGGRRMFWKEPGEGGGTFSIVAYPEGGASLADRVKQAAGGKPRPLKAWMVAEGKSGDFQVAAVARKLDGGGALVLVLSAKKATFRQLGGVKGLVGAGSAVTGFKPSAEALP